MSNASNAQIALAANGGASFNGRDAVDVYRIALLQRSLKTYDSIGLIPTRGFTISKMLKLAGEYTGKKYKRGQALIAAADLEAVLAAQVAKCDVTSETV